MAVGKMMGQGYSAHHVTRSVLLKMTFLSLLLCADSAGDPQRGPALNKACMKLCNVAYLKCVSTIFPDTCSGKEVDKATALCDAKFDRCSRNCAKIGSFFR